MMEQDSERTWELIGSGVTSSEKQESTPLGSRLCKGARLVLVLRLRRG